MAPPGVRDACKAFAAAAGTDAETLAVDVLRATTACTKQHVERCTRSAIKLLRSSVNAVAFGKFMLALSKTLPSSTKRLHILHIMTAVQLAVTNHPDPHQIDSILKRHMPLLLSLATFADPIKDPQKTFAQVLHLLSIWYDNEIFSPDETLQLYERVLAAETMTFSKTWEAMKTQITAEEVKLADELDRELEDAKWILPKRHGVLNDPTAPWYELPAANGLYMKRTRGYPLQSYALPPGGYELRTDAPNPNLKPAVSKLHTAMLHALATTTTAADVKDIDALGNIIYRDPSRPTRNYWGWSLDKIALRKTMGKDFQERAVGYADVPAPRRSAQVQDDLDRARRMAGERFQGAARGVGRGGYSASEGGWRTGGVRGGYREAESGYNRGGRGGGRGGGGGGGGRGYREPMYNPRGGRGRGRGRGY
ncbi:hypothetical protein LTR08_006120 [Meristemomyces frigidus]|nr:hypothetical protein LTR08_006120 [Meristemomyces frigidus]